MKKLLVIIIFFISFQLFSQPKIFIEGKDIFNWGNVEIGKMPVKTKIKIYNKGNDNLIITEAKPNCSCTTINLDKYNIPPKSFATLDVNINIHSDGPAEKYVTIRSNDPKDGLKNIILRANVIGHLTLSEKIINFRNASIGKEIIYHLKLKNNTNKPIKIIDLKIEPNSVSTNLNKNQILAAKKQIDVTVTYKPVSNTYMNGLILIVTDDKEVGDFGLSILGTPVQ